MTEEFTTKNMSDLLYDELSQIQDNNEGKTEALLQTPTTESIFPCRVINTPIDSILKSENGKPVLKDFQMTIEHWCDSQRQCMEMASIQIKYYKEEIYYEQMLNQYFMMK